MKSDTEAYVNDPGTFTTPSSLASLAVNPLTPPSTVIHFSQPPNLADRHSGRLLGWRRRSAGWSDGQTYYVIAARPVRHRAGGDPGRRRGRHRAKPLDASTAAGTQTLTPAGGSR